MDQARRRRTGKVPAPKSVAVALKKDLAAAVQPYKTEWSWSKQENIATPYCRAEAAAQVDGFRLGDRTKPWPPVTARRNVTGRCWVSWTMSATLLAPWTKNDRRVRPQAVGGRPEVHGNTGRCHDRLIMPAPIVGRRCRSRPTTGRLVVPTTNNIHSP
jgi:hypothetical protein